MNRCVGSQTNQDEVLDDYYHISSALGTLRFNGHVISVWNLNLKKGAVIGFYTSSNFDQFRIFTYDF